VDSEDHSLQGSGSVRALDRAIDLIEVLLVATSPMSLHELSARVDLHPSTTHRLLSTLVKRNFVSQDPTSKQYFLGSKLSLPSRAQAVIENFQNVATPILRELSQMTGEAASMAIRSGNQVMYIAQATSGRLVNMFVQIGALVPMYCTGVGKAILANLPSLEVNRITEDGGLLSLTPKTIVEVSRLQGELEKIRKNGFAIDDEEREVGIRCVAAPIFSQNGKLIGAISISGPAGRITPDQDSHFAELVQLNAKKISERLGT
jgi:IclR family KDG regulon transcriptional repressor